MGLVRRLPESLQNQIAAGEVVERPASVVKELVENSLDAGAGNVSVELEDGGHRLIRVADDGSGMSEEDLLLAVERHATSKIRELDDLFKVASMGFRGEALPSIASVSRTTITTCLPGGGGSSQLVIEGGKALRLSPAKQRRGTLVEVRDLFFNTPARRKFLRSARSDNAMAARTLVRLALARPETGFRLQVNGAITFSAHPVATQGERIEEIFGADLAGKLLPLRRESADGVRIDGFIAAPPESRHDSTDIFILVNRRWIKHPALAAAIAGVFKSSLPGRRYPFAVINATIDPERLDVNVHPAKEEVRFENEALVRAGVSAAVKDALRDFAARPPGFSRALLPPAGSALPLPSPGKGSAPSERFGEKAGRPAGAAPPAERRGIPPHVDWGRVRERIRNGDSLPHARPADLPAHSPRPEKIEFSRRETDPPAGDSGKPDRKLFAGGYRVLGQVCGQYILVEGGDGLYFIDPHALHERWNFDRMREEGRRGVASTRLLLPLRIRLSPGEAALAPEAVEMLNGQGFDLSLADGPMLEVRAAPSYLNPSNVEDLVRQILADIEDAAGAVEARRERLLASLACRSSVLLGKTLPEEELNLLIDRFLNGGQLPTCPHGRPAGFVLSLEEMAKRLGR